MGRDQTGFEVAAVLKATSLDILETRGNRYTHISTHTHTYHMIITKIYKVTSYQNKNMIRMSEKKNDIACAYEQFEHITSGGFGAETIESANESGNCNVFQEGVTCTVCARLNSGRMGELRAPFEVLQAIIFVHFYYPLVI